MLGHQSVQQISEAESHETFTNHVDCWWNAWRRMFIWVSRRSAEGVRFQEEGDRPLKDHTNIKMTDPSLSLKLRGINISPIIMYQSVLTQSDRDRTGETWDDKWCRQRVNATVDHMKWNKQVFEVEASIVFAKSDTFEHKSQIWGRRTRSSDQAIKINASETLTCIIF